MTLGFALDFVVISTTGGPPQIFLASLSADLVRARNSSIWPIETWVYSLQAIPFVVFILGMRAALRDAGEEALADIAALAGVFFMALHTLHNLAILAVVNVLAPTYVAGAADAASTEAVARGLLGVAYAAFLPGGGIGGALLVLALASFAMAQRRSRAFPAWSGRLATFAAVLLTVAYLQYIVPAAFFIALPGYVAFILWTAAVSRGLQGSAPRRAPVTAAQPA